ncbi:MAG: pyridoxamine 5'-phosphate oxidase family protein [Candidatus Omnitrophica bacterium]|nr:pyridoxamine 5'-phosphate oxidase family protein [Candidatus Omnitrophota bacterium]
MQKLADEVIQFFHHQNFAIVTTIDKRGYPHNSCKGVIQINEDGKVYLLDLYKAITFENLKINPHMSITGVDEHKFKGYCLKGRAKIVTSKGLNQRLIKAWEERIAGRITQRLIKNVSGLKGHPRHPEALLPKPEYLIAVEVEEVVDLTPHHISY